MNNLETLLESYLQSGWAERMGWTLLHSLWQITLIASIHGATLLVLRNRSATIRYFTSCLMLLAMLVLPMVTFVILPHHTASIVTIREAHESPTTSSPIELDALPTSPQNPPATDAISPFVAPSEFTTAAPTAAPATNDRLFADFSLSLRPWLPWVTTAWLAGVLLLSLRPIGGWLHVHRLQRHGLTPLPDPLQRMGERLLQQRGIRRLVQFAQSTLVEVPTVVGYLQPVILLPASASTGLSMQQLELILIHELAHIRRHDYVVNLIQVVIEAILFYHPGVWWVSGKIRSERENCCDDAAIALSGDRSNYIQALVLLEEQRSPAVVLAANGGSLLLRVKRLLGQPQAESSCRTASAWLAGLLTIAIVAAALAVNDVTEGEPREWPQSALRSEATREGELKIENVPAAPGDSNDDNLPDTSNQQQQRLPGGLIYGIVQWARKVQLEVVRRAELTPDEETAYLNLVNQNELVDGEAGRLEKKSASPTDVEQRALDKIYHVYIQWMLDQVAVVANRANLSDEQFATARLLAQQGRFFPINLRSHTLGELLKSGSLSETEMSVVQQLYDTLTVMEEADSTAHESNDKNTDDVSDVVKQWLALIKRGDNGEASQLMTRGKNENADDMLSMKALLEAMARGNIAPKESHKLTNNALVVSNSIESGQHSGQSFLFHLVRNGHQNPQWKIHEVSMVGLKELVAQLGAFHDKPSNRPVDLRGFGPIIERTLERTRMHTTALNLDTNRLIHVPNDFDTNRNVTQDPIKWLAVRGIDLMPQENPNRGGKWAGVGGMFRHAVQVENTSWKTSDAPQVRERLTAAPQQRGVFKLRVTDGPYPVTYVFETFPHPTGSSHQGILQLLEADPETHSVRIRYKLIGEAARSNAIKDDSR